MMDVLKQENGFTLVELLVAIFIFAVIAAMGSTLLSGSLKARDQVGQSSQLLKQVQLTQAALRSDLAQLIGRTARTEYGSIRLPALRGGANGAGGGAEALLEFTHLGWQNPGAMEPRGDVQRVRYVLDDGKLLRRAFVRPDPTPLTPELSRTLIEGVREIEVAFIANGQRSANWLGALGEMTVVPDAIELTMDIQGLGRIRQVYLVGAVS